MSNFGILMRLAARNLRREARRSLLTASAMVAGLALLIISRTLADGAHEDWIEDGVRFGLGHVAFQAPGYRESGSLDDRLSGEQIRACLEALEATPLNGEVVEVITRLTVQGLASSSATAVPVRILGVEPESENAFSQMGDMLVEGRYLEDDDRLAAYVGLALAERMELEVGSRFVLTAQTAGGDIEGQLMRVRGIYRSGLTEMDEGLIHIPINTARDWLQAPEAATTIAVLLDHSMHVPRTVPALANALQGTGVRVLPWQESSPELDAAVRMDDYGDYVFHGILFFIVGLAILNAVLMSVLNRKREFGLLHAMGLSPGETATVVFWEGLFITFVSGVMGMLLGFAFVWLFWRDGLDLTVFLERDLTFSGIVFDPVMMPVFRFTQVIQSLVFTAIIGVAASLYPAFQAARIDPAEAMKFEH